MADSQWNDASTAGVEASRATFDERPAASVLGTDPWGEAVASFLTDLLHDVRVCVHTDAATPSAEGHHLLPPQPQVGADGRSRQFSLHGRAGALEADLAQQIPDELDDLPDAALRALTRITRATSTADLRYPSITRALHDVIIAEVVSDRLKRRSAAAVDLDVLVGTVANAVDYFAELSATRFERTPVTHGVVIAVDAPGLEPVVPAIRYPGRLTTRKRTPLLFDGTQAALVIDARGAVVRGVERGSLAALGAGDTSLDAFDEFPGFDGALTAAASAALRGVGIYLRSDQSIWIFDDGELLFVRRAGNWRSVAFESFTRALARLGATSADVARRIARAALRVSIQGHGAILAITNDAGTLDRVVQRGSRATSGNVDAREDVDDDLDHLLRLPEITSSDGIARLARVDGATIVDTDGHVVAYGAIVRSTTGRSEGARSAAASALSTVARVALSVSHDGPITVYHDGQLVLEVL